MVCQGANDIDEAGIGRPRELGQPIAAINGDFYKDERKYLGDPKGLQIMQGELVSAPSDWSCFWMDPAGQPQMTNVLTLFQVTWPDGQTLPIRLNEERTNSGAVLYTPILGPSTRTSGESRPASVLEANSTCASRGETVDVRSRATSTSSNTRR